MILSGFNKFQKIKNVLSSWFLTVIFVQLRLSLYIVSRKGYSFGWPTKNPNMSIRHGAYIHIYQNSGELFALRARLMAEWWLLQSGQGIVIINDVSLCVSELAPAELAWRGQSDG